MGLAVRHIRDIRMPARLITDSPTDICSNILTRAKRHSRTITNLNASAYR